MATHLNRRSLNVLLMFSQILAAQCIAQRPDRRIYSDVRYIEEAGDLLGSELELELDFTQSRAQGVLRFYEGGCGTPVPVSGTVTRNRIRLFGASDTYGQVEIVGTIGNRDLYATLLPKKSAKSSHKRRLKRIATAHC